MKWKAAEMKAQRPTRVQVNRKLLKSNSMFRSSREYLRRVGSPEEEEVLSRCRVTSRGQ